MQLLNKLGDLFRTKDVPKEVQSVHKSMAVNYVNDKPHFFKEASECSKTGWFDLYRKVGEPQVVLGKKISMLQNAIFVVKNSKGEAIENHKLLTLLDKPNPVNTLQMLLSDWLTNLEVTGESFIYAPKTIKGVIPSVMYVLPSTNMTVEKNTTEPFFFQTDLDGLIKSYSYDKNILERDNVAHVYQPDPKEFLKPLSTIEKIIKNISITDSTYLTKNTIYRNKGAIGILSTKSGDSDGGVPLGKTERERIESEYRRQYGIGSDQSKVIVTDTQMTWQHMSYPVSDLMLDESRLTDFLMCIDAFQMDRNVFSLNEGSTFANLRDGMRASYINTVIPLADIFASTLTTFFGLDAKGEYLEPDFSHVDWLKADELVEEQAFKSKVESFVSLYQANIISLQELRQKLGLD
jgi:phage portal protein BeeE